MLYGNALSHTLGTQGSTYPIQEIDALKWIESRLLELQSQGAIEKYQQRLQEKGVRSIEHPKPVSGLQHTLKPRVFEKDLSVVVKHDIVGAHGEIIQKAGTRLNPLKKVFSKKALLFLDGDDPKQLTWGLAQYQKNHGLVKLVLVNGPVLQLMREYQIPFYFDQAGRLVRYFGITQVPAKVVQRRDRLVIEEIKL